VESATPILGAAGYDVTPRAPTFPADRPRLTLDYIAVQGLRLVDSEVVPTRTSDHRAVVTTVDAA
jgi:endonuclease/exonuclease/phosphatase (EEP) superfamily protein YafD